MLFKALPIDMNNWGSHFSGSSNCSFHFHMMHKIRYAANVKCRLPHCSILKLASHLTSTSWMCRRKQHRDENTKTVLYRVLVLHKYNENVHHLLKCSCIEYQRQTENGGSRKFYGKLIKYAHNTFSLSPPPPTLSLSLSFSPSLFVHFTLFFYSFSLSLSRYVPFFV